TLHCSVRVVVERETHPPYRLREADVERLGRYGDETVSVGRRDDGFDRKLTLGLLEQLDSNRIGRVDRRGIRRSDGKQEQRKHDRAPWRSRATRHTSVSPRVAVEPHVLALPLRERSLNRWCGRPNGRIRGGRSGVCGRNVLARTLFRRFFAQRNSDFQHTARYFSDDSGCVASVTCLQ